MIGPLASLLTVADGAQEAIAAALGAAAGAVAVAELDAAVAILAALKSQDAGQAGLVIGTEPKDRGIAAAAADGAEARPRPPQSRSGRGSLRARLRPVLPFCLPGSSCRPRPSSRPRSMSCWAASWSSMTWRQASPCCATIPASGW